MQFMMTRRHMMLGATSFAALALAGCATTTPTAPVVNLPPPVSADILNMYATLPL